MTPWTQARGLVADALVPLTLVASLRRVAGGEWIVETQVQATLLLPGREPVAIAPGARGSHRSVTAVLPGGGTEDETHTSEVATGYAVLRTAHQEVG